MAYKKYIKRNGKLYGPYIYHSRRVNGKVISEYQGTGKKIDYKKFIFIFLGVIFILGIGYVGISNKVKFTGNVVGDLDVQVTQGITDLSVIQLHEINESVHKYDLNLEAIYSSNLPLNYDWEIDCGYFYVDDEDVGKEYSGSDNVVEWHTTSECAEAILNIKVTSTDTTQELVQPIFNPEDRLITNISFIQKQENETEEVIEEINIVEEEEEEVDAEEITIQEVIPKEIEIVQNIFPLSAEEKQILINEFGNYNITSEMKLFNGRIIVRYEYGEMWIESSYDSYLVGEELEEQMEIDRVKWLRDIINEILKEQTAKQ